MDELSLRLVNVRFVGGPLHGMAVDMENPPFTIPYEADPKRVVEYCRRMVESVRDERNREMYVATYAPTGISETEFVRQVLRAAKDHPRRAPNGISANVPTGGVHG